MALRIVSTGIGIPADVVSNVEFEVNLDTSNEWIFSHTGIRQRYWLKDDAIGCSDLAAKAGLEALNKIGVDSEDIDLIIVATSTPEHYGFPSVAALVQEKIQAKKAVAYDVSAACAGFVFALETAYAMNCLPHKRYKNILVIGSEVLSRILNKEDRSTAILFGDGAGAVLLQDKPESSSSLLHSSLFTDGSGADSLYTARDLASQKTTIHMNGREVYNFGISVCQSMIENTCKEYGIKLEDIKYIVPHQANLRMIQALAKRMKISMAQFFLNVENYANTSAASIPIALYELGESEKIKKGDILLLLGFGAGLNYGSLLLEY